MPIFGAERVIDRYLLLPILTLIQIIFISIKWQTAAGSVTRSRSTVIILVIVIAGTLTTMATHDYLAWNRARWVALNYLVDVKGVSPTKIDGGFEFNGMYLYSKDETSEGIKGWWVVNNEYLIAYSLSPSLSLEGYQVEARYSVDTYLSVSPKSIFILHKP